MEEILGVTQDSQFRRGASTQGAEELGEDTVESDLQSEAEGNDKARHRYQRMFWEPVLEGKVGHYLKNIRKRFTDSECRNPSFQRRWRRPALMLKRISKPLMQRSPILRFCAQLRMRISLMLSNEMEDLLSSSSMWEESSLT